MLGTRPWKLSTGSTALEVTVWVQFLCYGYCIACVARYFLTCLLCDSCIQVCGDVLFNNLYFSLFLLFNPIICFLTANLLVVRNIICSFLWNETCGLMERCFTLWRPAGFGDFRENNTEMHVALYGNFSNPVSATDLVKGSKDVASLLVCTLKKLFGWGMRIFCE